jgi:putative endonuclease
MYYVYVLWSERLQKRYVGSTENVAGRLKQHNLGKARFTRTGMPWILLHQEEFANVSAGRARESFLKSGVGREWLDQQFPGYRRKSP